MQDQELVLQMRALITAAMRPDDVLDTMINEAAEGDHQGLAACLVEFVVDHTCVAPTVGRPEDMLTFMVDATLRVMDVAAQVLGQDPAAFYRGLLSEASITGDPTLPAAQALLAAGLVSDERLQAVVPLAASGSHAVIESLGDVCLTAYSDAAEQHPRALLAVLLSAAIGIIGGLAQMAGCPPETVVTAYWEQLVLTDPST